ncbi:MAG: hypothetical protein K0S28_737 [Paucimonas sp.]|nr:hypothetical protein [Paucimonas sp.]
MKKIACGLALTGIAASGAANAQTSLTIYGLLDAGVQISRFGNGTQTALASGMADGSRLGFRGTEDLGNGYKAIFNLEGRIELDTGANSNGYPVPSNIGQSLAAGLPTGSATSLAPVLQPAKIVNPTNSLFDRTSMVGLATPYGAVMMGRQYTPGYEVLAISDTFEAGTAAGWGSITGGTGGFLTSGMSIRANQSVQYRVQLPSGFSGAVMYGFNNTGALNLSRHFSGANLRYQRNGFNLGIGYNSEDDQSGNRSLTSFVAGGSYTFGDAKFFAGYMTAKNDHSVLVALLPQLSPSITPATAAVIGSNARLDMRSYTAGMHYKIGSGRIMASIGKTNNLLLPDTDVTLFGLGYDYHLSKRTDMYAIATRAANESNAQYALGGAGYAGGFTTRPGDDATALQLGIRHKF